MIDTRINSEFISGQVILNTIQNKLTILYIASVGRSGSTLLNLMLNDALHQTSVGELFNFWKVNPSMTKCGCGQIIEQCPFWRKIFAECGWQLNEEWFVQMRNLRNKVVRWRNILFLMSPNLTSPSFRNTLNLYVQRCEMFYSAVAKISGSSVVIDSSNNVLFLLLMKRFINSETNLLHLVRDPRAVVFSWSFSSKRRPELISTNSYMKIIPLPKVVYLWWLALFFPFFARSRVTNYYYLSYEELVNEPGTVMRSILASFQLSGDLTRLTDGHLDLNDNHTGVGNPIRFQSDPVKIESDERWRDRMPFMAQLLVLVFTWPWFLWKYIRKTAVG